MPRRAPGQAVLVVALTAAASLTCGGEPAGPDPNAVASVVITTPPGSVDTGDSLHLSAVTRNAAGTDLSGKTITWSTLDATLVTVSGTGVVRGRWPGVARVVATSEGKADTAQVQVTPRITSIDVIPALDTLRSLGNQVTLSVVAYIDAQQYAGGTYTWERSDTSFINLFPNNPAPGSARALARRNGTTIVRVREARGASDSAQIVVRQRVARFFAFSPASQAYRGCPLTAGVLPIDSNGVNVLDAVLTWASTDTTLARVDANGLITPLAVGTDTIVVTAQGGASFRFAVAIEAAPPMPLYMSAVNGEATATVGERQYATGQGRVGYPGASFAPGRFRVVSSDTTVAAAVPPDTTLESTYPFFSGPMRIVGRNPGSVTLTPYLCDVQGPPVTLTVTRSHLGLITPMPANARTDDAPQFQFIYTQDSAGVTHYPAEPVTVLATTTDTTVMRTDVSVRHLPAGSPATLVHASFLEPGSARLVVSDSAGVYVPDSSTLVHIAYPPLFFYRLGDTLHLGMRQRAYPAWDPTYVYVDRIVSGAPLPVPLTSSDTALVRIIPDSVDLPVGNTGVAIDVASGSTRGIATINAHAYRHTDAHAVVVVGRPAVQASQIGGIVYPGDSSFFYVLTADSTTSFPRIAGESVTFSLSSSDTTIVAVDSTTLTVPVGNATSSNTRIRYKGAGSAVITVSDLRNVPYAYSGTSLPVTVSLPYLAADSAVSVGVGQLWGFHVLINGPVPPGQAVRVVHSNPTVATLADSIASLFIPGLAVVGVTGMAVGVDTVIASMPGFVPDTGVIVVGMGTSDLVTWPPFGLTVGGTWPLYLNLYAPNGETRQTADTVVFTLTTNGNIDFIQDGVPITTVTMTPDQGSPQFHVRGKAAGTGTVTVSAANYTPVTKTITVAP